MNKLSPLILTNLTPLMKLTSGIPEIKIGLIDGPIAVQHPDFEGATITEIPGKAPSACFHSNSFACQHGTLIAGILSSKRSSGGLAICPNCTLVVCPIFSERITGNDDMPSAVPSNLAEAIVDCLHAGVRIINLSVALAQSSINAEQEVEEALNHAARREVLVVAAAGNQGRVGSSAITRHPWVIPVVACDGKGHPMAQSNLGISLARNGLSAPGEGIPSLGVNNQPGIMNGTSAAVPFVSGAMALLLSEFPASTGGQIRNAITHGLTSSRSTIFPPVLDAWGAYQRLQTMVN